MANVISVIHPYKYNGTWVFDDEKFELIQEPFVSGADDVIEMMVAEINNAEKGFTLLFLSTHVNIVFQGIKNLRGCLLKKQERNQPRGR